MKRKELAFIKNERAEGGRPAGQQTQGSPWTGHLKTRGEKAVSVSLNVLPSALVMALLILFACGNRLFLRDVVNEEIGTISMGGLCTRVCMCV